MFLICFTWSHHSIILFLFHTTKMICLEMFISKSFPQLLVWSTLSYLHLQLQTVTCLRNLNSVFPRWPTWLTDSQLRTRLIVRSFAKATPDAVISPSWRPIFPSTLGSQTSSATCGRSVSQRWLLGQITYYRLWKNWLYLKYSLNKDVLLKISI